MAFREHYTREQFAAQLVEVVSPSRPVVSVEHLLGRETELDRIEKALLIPGKNVFIFGERGVGKSSLAATAANQWQSSDASYIDVSCSPTTTISSLVSSIASQAIKRHWLKSNKETRETIINLRWLSHSVTHENEPVDIADQIRNIGDAIDVLKEVSSLHSETPVVVVDEVDRIRSEDEIDLLADLLKQIGDKRVDLKFIFTGVGKTLNEILGAHHSAIRQLETIELPRLSWDARWEIARAALKEFGVEIEKSIYVRIAAVSDGYPYYVHLIVEKLLWLLFEKNEPIQNMTWTDYFAAVNQAILSISAELARPYELATNHRSLEYEKVLWSTSVDEWQGAHIAQMFEAYEKIMESFDGQPVLSKSQFSSRIRNLLKPEYGQILIKGDRRGLYLYKEKMLRGYVRMQAEANNVEIMSEEAKSTIKSYMHVPAKNVGYYKSQPPKGVKQS